MSSHNVRPTTIDSRVLISNLGRHTLERLFATDLMVHISRAHGLQHIPFENVCRFGSYGDSPFKKNIREAVDRMMDKSRTLSLNLYAELVGFRSPSVQNFELAARQMGFQLNVDGFKERAFLEFCTTVCLMAVLARRNGIVTAPNCAVVVIDDIVQWFKMTGGWPENGWEDIEKEAEFFQY